MTAEDIFKLLFLMLCDTEHGKATITEKVLNAVPDDFVNRIAVDKPNIGTIRIRAIAPDQIKHKPAKNKREHDMNATTIFKILFALLCFQEDSEIEAPMAMLAKVPKNWPSMLRLDRPSLGLYRLQVENNFKPGLWDLDILVPMTHNQS